MWTADRLLPLLLLLASGAAGAAEPPVGMLWQVQGKQNSLYLLGSVHMLRAGDFPLPDAIEAAYQDAETLIMELDMDDLNPLLVQGLFFTHGTLPSDQTLASVLGAENYARARTAAARLDLDLDMLSRVKPWRAALTVVQLQLTRLGFDPALGLESHFTRRAGQDDKPIEGLETVAFQVQLFDAMSIDRQVQLLMKSLDDAATVEEDIDELVSAWRAGRVARLEQMQDEAFEDFPRLYETLIRERNEAWVDALRELLDDEQDYLVVVGALHLVGEDGVPAALRREGYKIERR